VVYVHGMDVEAEPGTEVLISHVAPYFDRTYEHFCSHRQTPSSGETGGPAVVRKGRAIYFSNPIFTEYEGVAPRWLKQLFLNALDLLLGQPLARHDGPTTLRLTVNEQAAQNRWVVHLLHYIPERRSQYIDVIEDVIPVYNVTVSVKAPRDVKSVQLAPAGKPLRFTEKDGRVEFTVPEISGHQMVVLGF
jgi:hypothetical protein